jgi:hypothetical protein
MTGGGGCDSRAVMMTWAEDARVRSAACAAQALVAAASAAAIGTQVDRMIERMAERNPEYAGDLQAIIGTAADQRAAIAEHQRSRAEGRPAGQLPHSAPNEAAASTELNGLPADLAIVHDRGAADGERQDAVVQRIFAAALTLQDAAAPTTEPEVRWRTEAAVSELDELIRFIRGTLFSPAHRPASREPGSGPDGAGSPAR